MTLTLHPAELPAMHRTYPGYWVEVDGDPLGFVYVVTHLVGETWYALRWHDEGWTRFATKQAGAEWIARTARRREVRDAG